MLQPKQKAIFFDWDGTAVRSRQTPPDDAINAMKPLLAQGVKLVIVSGTTYERIAGGHIETYFTQAELGNLYLGLGRGAFNYAFDQQGQPYVFADCIPKREKLADIHRVCFDIHMELLLSYEFHTDIVFSRPNYCKIDLMANNDRGDLLFLQEGELGRLRDSLKAHGMVGGLRQLLDISTRVGERYGIKMIPTCDAKYLEVGISSKSDNVDTILGRLEADDGIHASECSFWGDEYVGIEEGIYGSDSFMLTCKSRAGSFFDVSDIAGKRPEGVTVLGGNVETFLRYLQEQAEVV